MAKSPVLKIPPEVLALSFSYLAPFDVIRRVSVTSRLFHVAATLDGLWAEFFEREGLLSFLTRACRRRELHKQFFHNVERGSHWDPLLDPLLHLVPSAKTTQTLQESTPPTRRLSYRAAFYYFCSTCGAKKLLGSRHHAFPNGFPPPLASSATFEDEGSQQQGGSPPAASKFADERSNAILGATSLFAFMERLMAAFEDFLLLEAHATATYLAFSHGVLPCRQQQEEEEQQGPKEAAGHSKVPRALSCLRLLCGSQEALDEPMLVTPRDENAAVQWIPSRAWQVEQQGPFRAAFGTWEFYDHQEFLMAATSPQFLEPQVTRMLVAARANGVVHPIAVGLVSKMLICVVLTATERWPRGSVVSLHTSMRRTQVIAPNIETFLFHFVRNVAIVKRFPVLRPHGAISLFPSFDIENDYQAPSHDGSNTITGAGGGVLVAGAYGVSIAVTNGVEIVMSPLLIPPECTADGTLVYAYQCRMRLLPSAPFVSCQLLSRRWEVTSYTKKTTTRRGEEGGGVSPSTQIVEGDGVIGLYPLLQRMSEDEATLTNPKNATAASSADVDAAARAKLFHYCSCTHFSSPRGVMQGYLYFVPGSHEQPAGDKFAVRVAPFQCVYDEAYRLQYGV